MTKNWQQLKVETIRGVPVISFQRPEKLNALNSQLFREIKDAVEWLGEIASSNAIIITGTGRGFIAGADLGEYGSSSAEDFEAFQALGQTVYDSLRDSELIIIAAVNGYALGGGMEMVLASDVVFSSSNAKLGLPEIGVGLLPGGGGTVYLRAFLPAQMAKDIILSGRLLTAEEARAIGLVQYVCEPDSLVERAVNYGEALNTRSPEALIEIKRALDPRHTHSFAEGLVKERAAVMHLFGSANGREGVGAFLEKRDPIFRRRGDA